MILIITDVCGPGSTLTTKKMPGRFPATLAGFPHLWHVLLNSGMFQITIVTVVI